MHGHSCYHMAPTTGGHDRAEPLSWLQPAHLISATSRCKIRIRIKSTSFVILPAHSDCTPPAVAAAAAVDVGVL